MEQHTNGKSKMNDIIKTTLENMKTIVESNTIIGDPIETAGGVVVIPVSKVSLGFASGGLDYASKKEEAKSAAANFGGGGGTGMSVSPVAFLVIRKDGSVELLNIANQYGDTAVNRIASIGDIFERSPDVIERLKNVFTGKKKEESAEEKKEADETKSV